MKIKKLTDESPMPFGKHKGTEMSDVPADYLLWLGEQMAHEDSLPDWKKPVYDYIEDNYEALQKEVEK
jgi:hypothetical protein